MGAQPDTIARIVTCAPAQSTVTSTVTTQADLAVTKGGKRFFEVLVGDRAVEVHARE